MSSNTENYLGERGLGDEGFRVGRSSSFSEENALKLNAILRKRLG